MERFAEYNAYNLLTHNVRHIGGTEYALVHRSHPIMFLIKDNAQALQLDVDSIGNREWTKVSHTLINTCCHALWIHVFKVSVQS